MIWGRSLGQQGPQARGGVGERHGTRARPGSTEGSRHSNATRVAAAAAAAVGLRCTSSLCHDEPTQPVGNLFPMPFGADLVSGGDVTWAELAHRTAQVGAALQEQGERVYRLPIGSPAARGRKVSRVPTSRPKGNWRPGRHRRQPSSTPAPAGPTRASRSGAPAAQPPPASSASSSLMRVYDDVPWHLRPPRQRSRGPCSTSRPHRPPDLDPTTAYPARATAGQPRRQREATDMMARLEGIVASTRSIHRQGRRGPHRHGASPLDRRTSSVLAHRWLPLIFDPSYSTQIWDGLPRLSSIAL